ncbi:helix-turn-helix domain-containing protein [Agromyces sp. NPDC057679]|uniref:helix-turn-helix domain-containing protein n=1 Tax=Agromyces sp. NPDC057679 TaxID=3346207 RepID=UPI003670882B
MTAADGVEPSRARALDVPRLVMRVRRLGDLSQRDLARVAGISQPQIARIERSLRGLDVRTLERILGLAGLRLAVVDDEGAEVFPVSDDVIRDNAGRLMPAHLDVRVPTDRPRRLLTDTRYDRAEPQGWYHHRAERDRRRRQLGTTSHVDQPTRPDAAAARRVRHGSTSGRPPDAAIDDCGCLDECWDTRGCASRCSCRCGG